MFAENNKRCHLFRTVNPWDVPVRPGNRYVTVFTDWTRLVLTGPGGFSCHSQCQQDLNYDLEYVPVFAMSDSFEASMLSMKRECPLSFIAGLQSKRLNKQHHVRLTE